MNEELFALPYIDKQRCLGTEKRLLSKPIRSKFILLPMGF
ncbi:hypothetical protein CDSM653_02455 [Caldanaerobacter subterraneus subsp. pacificus DSM 12653]|uniref:Uncharacterized protein n=2 Tax=Bacteria TaxID=2 RepID=B5Y784_COPPD|nr:hypothetical protein CDSM653_02455 [Caldanaerobacter subterraneus subsp. pacificus DSM 12653]